MMPTIKPSHRKRSKQHRVQSDRSAWERYELLKRDLTASAKTAAEYDAACRRAAELAGV
jgi:hypothetical protein